jgi:hypothetical protein
MQEVSPAIWRRIEVPAGYTFWDLHVAIQDAMGWTDSHLHAFRILTGDGDPLEIGLPDPHGEFDVVAGWTRKLTQHFKTPGDRADYEYDFGDGWQHEILLEEIVAAGPDATYPRCLDGARRCPPEDCGGPYGYAEFLKAVENKRHPGHREMLEWCGGAFDPEVFDPAAVHFDDPQERRRTLD